MRKAHLHGVAAISLADDYCDDIAECIGLNQGEVSHRGQHRGRAPVLREPSAPGAVQPFVQAAALRIAQQMPMRAQQPQDLLMRLHRATGELCGGGSFQPLPLGGAGRRRQDQGFGGHGALQALAGGP